MDGFDKKKFHLLCRRFFSFLSPTTFDEVPPNFEVLALDLLVDPVMDPDPVRAAVLEFSLEPLLWPPPPPAVLPL